MSMIGIWFTGLVMALLALLGLKLAAGAVDLGMAIFGTGLFVFGIAFIFGLLKHYADRAYGGDH